MCSDGHRSGKSFGMGAPYFLGGRGEGMLSRLYATVALLFEGLPEQIRGRQGTDQRGKRETVREIAEKAAWSLRREIFKFASRVPPFCKMNLPPVGSPFMSPAPVMDPRQMVEQEEAGLDVGIEPGAGLGGYPGMDGDLRIISREIYQGKTFDDWDDMEANVRRLARKAGFKVVKVR